VSVSRIPGTDETVLGFRVRSPGFWKGYYPDGVVTLSTGQSFPARVQVYSAQSRSYALQATVTDPAFFKAFAAASTIAIAHKDFGHVDVSVKDATAAATALRSCENSRLQLWGVDPATVWALQSRPVPIEPPQEWFTAFDYPGLGLTKEIGADIIAKLDVGEDGSVRSCTWLGPHEYPQFGDVICKGLKERARFHPARDVSGHAVSAPYVTIAAFRMAAY
jgi:hypothetical protein